MPPELIYCNCRPSRQRKPSQSMMHCALYCLVCMSPPGMAPPPMRKAVAASCVVLFLLALPAAAQPQPANFPMANRSLRALLLSTRINSETRMLIARKLEGLTAAELAQLSQDPDLSISMRAIAQETWLQNNGADAREEFCRRLEQRLNIRLPHWYKKLVREADGEMLACDPDVIASVSPYPCGHCCHALDNWYLEFVPSKEIVYAYGDDGTVIEVSVRDTRVNRSLAACESGDWLLFATHGHLPDAYEVVGVHSKTKEQLRWHGSIRSEAYFFSGVFKQYISIRINEHYVVVSGIGNAAMFVDVFDRSSGECVGRYYGGL